MGVQLAAYVVVLAVLIGLGRLVGAAPRARTAQSEA
jgi:hypothetical protein